MPAEGLAAFVKFAEATALFRVTFFSLSLGICLSFCPALRPCSTFRCSSPPARPLPHWQLTKRALVGGDTEKVALEWANEQVWAGCTGQIAGQESRPSASPDPLKCVK